MENDSVFWTKKKFIQCFYLDYDELLVYGGGSFTLKQAKQYIIHSKLFLNMFYSNKDEFKKIIMFRGFVKRYSKKWNNKIIKNNKRGDKSHHNVFISCRTFCNLNQMHVGLKNKKSSTTI